MPDNPNTLVLPDTDLKGLTPPSYNPVSQKDVASVATLPNPVFKASNTDVQAVTGTTQQYVPSTPVVPASTVPQAEDEFPARIQAVGGADPAAFIVHHTSGRGTVEGVQQTLRERGLGVEYVMDRGDKDRGPRIYATGGPGAANIQPGWGDKGAGLSNANVVGMEIIANDDKDVTDQQKQLFAKFIQARYPKTNLLGHGEVNPGHKEADEGLSAKLAALALRTGQTGDTATASSATRQGI